ncbi:poly-gamma-glutamate hydrolase family protein [Colwellia sp. BRX8-9]|nr:poly-gamma-glutamate hydrolase family protein [Colwellia sp. BRX8-9]MBA6350058.1 poly-gamma-glutamate hydrolase family protein [Colwellia sp. BRX8-9]
MTVFLELSMNEDKFSVEVQDIGSPITIMAIHGGRIEPGTSNIVKAIAGRDFNIIALMGKS